MLGKHFGPGADPPEMAGIANRHSRHAMRRGARGGDLHRLPADDLAKAEIAVDDDQRAAIADDARVSIWPHLARAQPTRYISKCGSRRASRGPSGSHRRDGRRRSWPRSVPSRRRRRSPGRNLVGSRKKTGARRHGRSAARRRQAPPGRRDSFLSMPSGGGFKRNRPRLRRYVTAAVLSSRRHSP